MAIVVEEAVAKPKAVTARQIRSYLRAYLRLRADAKARYERADKLLQQIIATLPVGAIITHPQTGEEFEIVDNFKDRNTAFKACGVDRIYLKPIKGTKNLGGGEA